LQALQYFGHFMPVSTLPAALAAFHSAAHLLCRSLVASCFGDRSFFDAPSLLRRERRDGASLSGEAACARTIPDGAESGAGCAGMGAATATSRNAAAAAPETGIVMTIPPEVSEPDPDVRAASGISTSN
jgi:hypothetical protein